jgi:pimeloyl-ACP methyl ester carboxylesterase
MHPPEEPSKRLGVRIIVIERPGFGLSDFQPGRWLLDWPVDVLAFADLMGIDRFLVAGISGGGPYAAACAYKIPDRLDGTAIISGSGPINVSGSIQEMPRVRQAGAIVAKVAPWLLRPVLWLVSNPQRSAERFYQRMVSGNSELDRSILTKPEMKARLIRSYLEATRNGVRGFAHEAIILSNPWSFPLEDIRIPVYLWHGEQDANVSLSAAKYMAQKIPDCHANFLPDQGHWLILDHWEEILVQLLK